MIEVKEPINTNNNIGNIKNNKNIEDLKKKSLELKYFFQKKF